jgi:hypothetical protein
MKYFLLFEGSVDSGRIFFLYIGGLLLLLIGDLLLYRSFLLGERLGLGELFLLNPGEPESLLSGVPDFLIGEYSLCLGLSDII